MHNGNKVKTASLTVLLVSMFLLYALAGAQFVGQVSAAGYTEYIGTLGGADFVVRFPDPWNGMLVIVCRGYSPTSINATSALDLYNTSNNVSSLLDQGFAVAASSYGSTGFCIQKGINTTYELTNYVINTYHITGKVFLYGISMGGAVALLLGEKYPDLYSGVLDVYGVKDLKEEYTVAMFVAVIENETGGTPTTQPKAYEDRSPTYHANIMMPVITIHGTSDIMVPFNQSINYQTAVANAGRSSLYRLYNVTGVGHLSPAIAAEVPSRFSELVAWSNALTGSDWPMFGHDLQHTGYSASPAPSTNQTLWNYTVGGFIASSPAIANGKVYVGSYDYKFYCLDAATGAHIWNYTTGGIVGSSPAVVDSKVYVGSDDDNIYCLDAASGALLWNYTTGGDVVSCPTVSSDMVYVGSKSDLLYCLNASTGAYMWSYMTSGDVLSSPAIADGKVYVGSYDNRVYCLNALTGAHIWNYTTGGWVWSSPAVADGKVYVGSNDTKVYALNALTGALVWNFATGAEVVSSPAVVDGKVYVGSFDNKVYCLNASTGAHIWNYTTVNDVFASPAVADGKVYISSIGHVVYCLNAADGAFIWSYTTGLDVYSSPAVANGVVYVGSIDKKVYAIPEFPPTAMILTLAILAAFAVFANKKTTPH